MINEVYGIKIFDCFSQDKFDNLLKYIQFNQRNKILKFRYYIDALKSLTGNILARSIIMKKTGLSNQNIYFSHNKYGKPYLKSKKKLHFNISHSGEWVICGISDKLIGVDIEEIKNTDLVDINVENHFFTLKEQYDLYSHKERERISYFYNLWTLKESYIKALGKGLAVPLNSFTVAKSRSNKFFVIDNTKWQEDFYFKQYDVSINYKLSVCSKNNMFAKDIIISDLDWLYKDFLDKV